MPLALYVKSTASQALVHLTKRLGVPDTVSGPLIVPLNYLVILHQIQGDSKYMTSEIVWFHLYWNSAFQTPQMSP